MEKDSSKKSLRKMVKNDIAISVNHIAKTFKLPIESSNSIKQVFINRVKGIKGFREQKVLKDIDFQINKGDFFGIVGRNGSGKSTLLKIISGIYQPTTGNIQINGSLVSFIELGVGFNPELTGRENVYLNGAMLGFSKDEVSEMYDDIVEFAELNEFMDQKLKNYSSGMQVRLAFSCAIQAKSDILVLDEVLAVGDEAFQRKCNDFFESIKKDKSKTIILVTHDMSSVKQYCNQAMMIRDGEIVVIGSPEDVANEYSLENLQTVPNQSVKDDEKNVEVEREDFGIKNPKIKLLSKSVLDQTEEIEVEFSYEVTKDLTTFVDISIINIDNNTSIEWDIQTKDFHEGKGKKVSILKTNLPKYVNNCTLKIWGAVYDDKHEKGISFTSSENSPEMIIRRSDNTSSAAILNISGKWGK